MSKDGVIMTTPVGRVIWGSVCIPRAKTHQDGAQKGQKIIDPQTGQPIMEISFGLAIPKETHLRQLHAGNPQLEQIVAVNSFEHAVWPVMQGEIGTTYPHGVPQRFAYKFKDGDTAMSSETPPKPLREREGYAGHIVLSYTQRITDDWAPPPIFKFNPATNRYDTLAAGDVKCGDYFAIGTHFKCEPVTGTNTPSIYVNPKGIELVGYGTAIVSQSVVDPTQMFGGAQRMLPAGASMTPTQQPGAPTMPGMGAQPAAAGMPAAMPGAPAGMPVAGAPMAAGMPGAPMQAPVQQPVPVQPQPIPQPVGVPGRPVDPQHVYNNGNGTEQWLINGAWDGQQHPIPQAQPMQQPVMMQPQGMPAPAHDFVQNAGYVAPQPVAMPGAPVGMPQPGMPGNMPGMPPA